MSVLRRKLEIEYLYADFMFKSVTAEKSPFVERMQQHLSKTDQQLLDEYMKLSKDDQTPTVQAMIVNYCADEDPRALDMVHFGLSNDDIDSMVVGTLVDEMCQKIDRAITTELWEPLQKKIKGEKRYIVKTVERSTGSDTSSIVTLNREYNVISHRLIKIQTALHNTQIGIRFGGVDGSLTTHKLLYPKDNWSALLSLWVAQTGKKLTGGNNYYRQQVASDVSSDSFVELITQLKQLVVVLLDMIISEPLRRYYSIADESNQNVMNAHVEWLKSVKEKLDEITPFDLPRYMTEIIGSIFKGLDILDLYEIDFDTLESDVKIEKLRIVQRMTEYLEAIHVEDASDLAKTLISVPDFEGARKVLIQKLVKRKLSLAQLRDLCQLMI